MAGKRLTRQDFWEMSADELAWIVENAGQIRELKVVQRDLHDELPAEVLNAIGDVLEREDVRALGRLASTSRRSTELYRDRLKRIRLERFERRQFEKALLLLRWLWPEVGCGCLWDDLIAEFDQIMEIFDHPIRIKLRSLGFKREDKRTLEEMLSRKTPSAGWVVADGFYTSSWSMRIAAGSRVMEVLSSPEFYYVENGRYTVDFE